MTAVIPAHFSVAENGTKVEHKPLHPLEESAATHKSPRATSSLYSIEARTQRGRNPKRRRKSKTLTQAQAMIISRSVNKARALGLNLNHLLTIHWAKAPSSMDEADRLQLFLDRYRSWMRRRGVVPTYAFVREKVTSTKEHVHIMIHIPDRCRAHCRRMLDGWVGQGKEAGFIDPATWKLDPITPGTEHRVKTYILKGGDADVRKSFGSRRYRAAQGTISGKRAGISKNIR